MNTFSTQFSQMQININEISQGINDIDRDRIRVRIKVRVSKLIIKKYILLESQIPCMTRKLHRLKWSKERAQLNIYEFATYIITILLSKYVPVNNWSDFYTQIVYTYTYLYILSVLIQLYAGDHRNQCCKLN